MTWPTAIVHGDAHPGNVVVTAAGPILVDFDLAGAGPAMWDLTILVVHRRFGASGDVLSVFFAAYGSDPRGHSGFEVLVRVQELLCISYVLERLIAGAPPGQELTSRLQAVRKTDTPAPWHPLPPVDPQPQAQAQGSACRPADPGPPDLPGADSEVFGRGSLPSVRHRGLHQARLHQVEPVKERPHHSRVRSTRFHLSRASDCFWVYRPVPALRQRLLIRNAPSPDGSDSSHADG